ncbi:MAG: hypothetical protein JSV35_02075 [Candidatus Bathyarchaeota archaeon]|nr:MAG: hypothetical protein JSV35_02075 [Candidatus Bathyarchaeota archaeon]
MLSFGDPFFIVFVAILIVVNLCFMFLLKLIIDTKIRKKKDTSALLTRLTPSKRVVSQTEVEPKEEPHKPVEKVDAPTFKQTEPTETEVEPKVQEKPTGKWNLLKRRDKPIESVAPEEPRNGKVDFCPKYLGYLHTLPKGSVYPDECLRCRRIISCMGVQGGNAIEEFYADEAVVE